MAKTVRRTLGALLLLCASASLASASTISYYVDVFSGLTTGQLCVGPCPTGSTSTLATGPQSVPSVSIPKLDQTAAPGYPGTYYALSAVNITIDWRATGNVTVYNFHTANIAFDSAWASTAMTFTAGTDSANATGVAATGVGTATCCNINNGSGLPPFFGSTPFNGLTGSGSTTTSASNLGFFQGFGASNFSGSLNTNSVQVTGSSSDPNGGLLAYQGNGQMGAILSVTYTFDETAVPEPATAGLMGVALIGLGLFFRKFAPKR